MQKEHLIWYCSVFWVHTAKSRTQKSASQTAHDYSVLFRILTEKYTQNDLNLSILMSIHVSTPGYVLSECKLLGEYHQYIEFEWVLKGQQPNLIIDVCILIVNESTKERE